MSENSKIEWCDHTFNPWEGCTKVSPGCANCYAESRNARWNGGESPNWGKGAPRRRTSRENWKQPYRWNRKAEAEGTRPKVFCASLADWLDPEVPIEWLCDLLHTILDTPHLDWLLLTKRPEQFQIRTAEIESTHRPRDLDLIVSDWLRCGYPPKNVWLGTSAENQEQLVGRLPILKRTPAAIRFLSCEPLLGILDLTEFRDNDAAPLDWVICGGESGQKARPMNPFWAQSIRDQCLTADIPFFFKQWGQYRPQRDDDPLGERYDFNDGSGPLTKCSKKEAGRLLDGVEWSQFPSPTNS